MSADMSPRAVLQRLRRLSELSDLSAGRRLATKVDMAPAPVTRRLRIQAALRAACLAWGELGRRGLPERSVKQADDR